MFSRVWWFTGTSRVLDKDLLVCFCFVVFILRVPPHPALHFLLFGWERCVFFETLKKASFLIFFFYQTHPSKSFFLVTLFASLSNTILHILFLNNPFKEPSCLGLRSCCNLSFSLLISFLLFLNLFAFFH